MTNFTFIPSLPYRLIEKLQKTNLEQKNSNKHYAILIAGNAEDRHKNNLSLAYQVLLEQGYNKQDIYIFDSTGADTPLYPLIDQTNIKSIQLMFNWLAENVNETDTILFYMTGHGTKVGIESAYMLNKAEILYKKDFETFLSKINPNIGIIFSDFCYWGLIDNIKLSEYIFISVTDDNHVSAGTTFAREFWKSFRDHKNQPLISAYNTAYKKDPFTSKKNINNPNLKFIKNDPKYYNLLGEKH